MPKKILLVDHENWVRRVLETVPRIQPDLTFVSTLTAAEAELTTQTFDLIMVNGSFDAECDGADWAEAHNLAKMPNIVVLSTNPACKRKGITMVRRPSSDDFHMFAEILK